MWPKSASVRSGRGRFGAHGGMRRTRRCGYWRRKTNWVVAVFTGPARTVYVTWVGEDSRYAWSLCPVSFFLLWEIRVETASYVERARLSQSEM